MCKKRHAMLLLATVGQFCWLSFVFAEDYCLGASCPRRDERDLGEPWHGLGDIPPDGGQ